MQDIVSFWNGLRKRTCRVLRPAGFLGQKLCGMIPYIPYECVLGAGVAALYLWLSQMIAGKSALISGSGPRSPVTADQWGGAAFVFFVVTSVYLIDGRRDDKHEWRKSSDGPRASSPWGSRWTSLPGGASALVVPAWITLGCSFVVLWTKSPAVVVWGAAPAVLLLGLYSRTDHWNFWKKLCCKAHAVSGGLLAFLWVVHHAFDSAHVLETRERLSCAGLLFPSADELSLWCLVYVLIYLNASLGDVRDVAEDRRAGIPTLPAFTGPKGGLCVVGSLSAVLCLLLLANGLVHLWSDSVSSPVNFGWASIALASAYFWTSLTSLVVAVRLRREPVGRQIYNAGDLALFLPLAVALVGQELNVH